MIRRGFLQLFATCILASAALFAEGTFQTEIDRLAKLLNWQPGSTYADVGAGAGEMTMLLSDLAGPSGRVYSTDVDDERLKNLEELTGGLGNVTVLKGASDESNLPVACCDAILVRRVYHHFPDPAKMDASLFNALKPGGTLVIIDFEDRAGLPPVPQHVPKNRGHHGLSRSIVISELTAAGFEPGPNPGNWYNGDYCLVFRKPK